LLKKKPITFTLTVILLLVVIIAYGSPSNSTKMRFLKEVKTQLTGNQSLQKTFPEGLVFATVLYGINSTDLVRRLNTSQDKEKYLKEAVWALKYLDTYCRRNSKFEYSLNPRYGIFYSGWKNYLLGKIVSLRDIIYIESDLIELYQEETQEIVEAYQNSERLYLESYSRSIWPADNFVAIASVAEYGRSIDSVYNNFIAGWVEIAKSHLPDDETLFPHSVLYPSERIAEYARGSSQSLILTMLSEIDPALARIHLVIFKEKFHTSILGLDMIREYPIGMDGIGDVDSGPVIWGVGASASIAGLSAFYSNGDTLSGKELEKSIRILKSPSGLIGNLRLRNPYILIGELFYYWGLTFQPIDKS